MDKMQLVYAILQIRFPNTYRTAAGAKAYVKLSRMNCEELKIELAKWKKKRSN